ncbi:MAG: 4Fe-4S binding protein [Lachnospiraceae bacterium]|nr:4Fe-4S binding protein [Lachnospiraceae bacterium]
MKPRTGKSCIRCGLCAKECPAGAIPVEEPSKTDAKACISCMRCIEICPRKARSVSKTLLAASSVKMKKVCSGRKKNELFL